MEVHSLVNKQIHTDGKTEYNDFQTLFKTYYPRVLRRVIKMVGNQAIAEDLTQTVFIQLYKLNWQEIEHLSAWLNKSAKFAVLNYLRSEKRLKAREEKDAQSKARNVESSEEAYMHQEEHSLVNQTLKQLDEREQKLLLMKYSGFKYKEIAQKLQIEEGSVGTMLVRAKRKFKVVYESLRGDDE